MIVTNSVELVSMENKNDDAGKIGVDWMNGWFSLNPITIC
jgi:hypothetical protein